MPATYAAVTASVNALREITPDFDPESLLDIGAGPGTATWAAAEAFSSLRSFRLLDSNAALRALALDLGRDNNRLRDMIYQRGEARVALADAEPADLVVASYMIGEIDSAEQKTLAGLMWAKTRDTLLIVEPGTPAGYARILALRDQLIASGAHVAAPCPHDGKCPLHGTRLVSFHPAPAALPRAKQIKGAEVPFEDEKFAYIALTRAPTEHIPPACWRNPMSPRSG